LAGYILDTSAIMAVILEEDGADEATQVIQQAERVTVPFIALMEVEYRLARIKPEVVQVTLEMIDSWPVEVAESYYNWRRTAAEIKSRGRISLADAWVAALAVLRDAELVHKDPEFDAVDGLKALRLPYDRNSGGRA
jgi:ribonuclease VapC